MFTDNLCICLFWCIVTDALAIDVFNENLPMYHPAYPYPPTAVSCEDVDCYECRAARLMIQSKYASYLCCVFYFLILYICFH